MLYENNKLKFEYSDKWEEISDNIANCLVILDNKENKTRIMLMEHENQGVNIDFLKSAVELFPRDENLEVKESKIIEIGKNKVHKLVAEDKNMKTISMSLIHKTDVYIFNYISFNTENLEKDLENIVKSIEFKK